MQRRDLRRGELLTYLPDDLLDGAVLAERAHLDEAQTSGPVEKRLHLRQPPEDERVLAPARRREHSDDAELAAVQAQAVARELEVLRRRLEHRRVLLGRHRRVLRRVDGVRRGRHDGARSVFGRRLDEAERLRRVVADEQFVRARRLSADDAPPTFERVLALEIDARDDDLAPLGPGRAEELRRDDGQTVRVRDLAYAPRVLVRQLAHVEGGRGHRDAAVVERELLGLRHDDDVRAVLV